MTKAAACITRQQCAAVDAVFVAAHCRRRPGSTKPVPRKTIVQREELEALYLHPPGTPGRVEWPVRYQVRPLASLVTSHDPLRGFQPDKRYPQGVQERDYEREPAEALKVAQLAAAIKPPLMLSQAVSAAEGPPIVTDKGNIVLSGNGRTMGLRLAFDRFPQSALSYRKQAEEFAKGIGIAWPKWANKQPAAIVRVVDIAPDSEAAKAFGLAANNRLGSERTEVRRAAALAGSLPDDLVLNSLEAVETLGDLTSGSAGRALREALWQSPTLPIGEKNALFHADGRLTDSGRAFFVKLLLVKALGSVEATEALAAYPSLLNTVQSSLAILLRMRRAAERGEIAPTADLGAHLQAALVYFHDFVAPAGYDLKHWRDFFRQRTLGDTGAPPASEEVKEGLRLLQKYVGKTRQFREFLGAYFRGAMADHIDATGMFSGGQRARTMRELVELVESEDPQQALRKELAELQTKFAGPGPAAAAYNPEAREAIQPRIDELREATGKQFWQQTQARVAAAHAMSPARHERYVREAIEAGKPVPPEVLAEYPHLAGSPDSPPGGWTARDEVVTPAMAAFLRKLQQEPEPQPRTLARMQNRPTRYAVTVAGHRVAWSEKKTKAALLRHAERIGLLDASLYRADDDNPVVYDKNTGRWLMDGIVVRYGDTERSVRSRESGEQAPRKALAERETLTWEDVKDLSLKELADLRTAIVENPANQTSGGLYLYTPSARRRLELIASVVTGTLAENRRQ